MPLINTDRLQCFIEAAEARSFSRAAERMQITQPAVSRHIRELEETVGTSLFHRTGRNVTLTEAGHGFLALAKKVVAAVETMESEAGALSEGLSGVLRLGGSTVWEYILPTPIGLFRRQFPRMHIGLTVGNTGNVIELIIAKRIHLGFVGEAPKEKDLSVTPIAVDELIIVAPPGHPLGGRRRVDPKELDGAPFIQREADSATARVASRYLAELGAAPDVALELGSHEALKAGVRAGFGVGMISRYSVANELASGALEEVLIEAPPCRRPLYVLQDPSRPVSPAEREFLQRLGGFLRATGATAA